MPKVLLFIFCLGCFHILSSQQLVVELHSKLAFADQKKLQKIDILFKKAARTGEEANLIKPNAFGKDGDALEKKYYGKRAEASGYYQEATENSTDIYNDYIKKFWKNFKGEKRVLEFAKAIESAATDSLKKSKDVRSSVKKEKKVPNQVQLLEQAESLEKNSLLMTQKVLYTYINWPIEYQHNWLTSKDQEPPKVGKDSIKQEAEVKEQTTPIAVPEVKPVATPLSAVAPVPSTPEATSTVATAKDAKPKEQLVGNDSSLYGRVKINEDMIDRFNKFLVQTYPADYENYIVNFQSLDYADISAIRKAWNVYTGLEAPDSSMIASNQVIYLVKQQPKSSVADDSKTGIIVAVPPSATSLVTENKIETGSKPISKVKPVETAPNKNIATAIPVNPEKLTPTYEQKERPVTSYAKVLPEKKGVAQTTKAEKHKKVIPSAESISDTYAPGFVFRLQLAACRKPADQKLLQTLYNGPEKITESYEGNWYKYIIGEFLTYREARKLRDELITKTPVFVIAYLNGKRIKITPAIAYNNKTNKTKK